jgi:hypothetical protein
VLLSLLLCTPERSQAPMAAPVATPKVGRRALVSTPPCSPRDATPEELARARELAGRVGLEGTVQPASAWGLRVTTSPASASPGLYEIVLPSDLDTDCTDAPPHAGRLPGLHLNLPLQTQPAHVRQAFLSDQPEEMRDERKREDGTTGTTGRYACARLQPEGTSRLLIDHTNGTKRPLRLVCAWIPDKPASLAVLRRGEAQHADSVRAGRQAFERALVPALEARHETVPEQPFLVVDTSIAPGATYVGHLEIAPTAAGRLMTAVVELPAGRNPSVRDLEQLPVLHNIVWREELARLAKFISPQQQPRRYARIASTHQHARGLFRAPDRRAWGTLRACTKEPLQAWSLYESVPGIDECPPLPPQPTHNRGRYGTVSQLDLRVVGPEPEAHRYALLALNRGSAFGGRHHVSDHKQHALEILNLPRPGSQLLPADAVETLWLGELKRGDTLTLWTEPMANVGVYLWYLLLRLDG